jgi:hypothetical protein
LTFVLNPSYINTRPRSPRDLHTVSCPLHPPSTTALPAHARYPHDTFLRKYPPLPSFVICPLDTAIGLQFAPSPLSSPASLRHRGTAPITPARLTQPRGGGRGVGGASCAHAVRVQVLHGDRLSQRGRPQARATVRARKPQRPARWCLQLACSSSQEPDRLPCPHFPHSHTRPTQAPAHPNRPAFVIDRTLASGTSR